MWNDRDEMHIIDSNVYKSIEGFTQVYLGDEVDTKFGYWELAITRSDIEHLLNGGVLYHSDGEYARCVALNTEHLEYTSDKETPMMLHSDRCGSVYCPRCYGYLQDYHESTHSIDGLKQNYCDNCGQRLIWDIDWEKE